MSFERGYQNSLVVLKYRQQIREGLDVLTERERKGTEGKRHGPRMSVKGVLEKNCNQSHDENEHM